MTELKRGRRIRIDGPHKVTLEDFDVGKVELRNKETLVKTIYSLISAGTELSIYTALDQRVYDPRSWAHYPFYPGYAAVGRVLKKGSDVSSLSVNDVVYMWGKHASHSVIDTSKQPVLVLTKDVDLEKVPFIRMATIAITAVDVSTIKIGSTVAVLGLGLVGNLAAQLFKLSGARVIGIELSPGRRELGTNCGIDTVIDPAVIDLNEVILQKTAGLGADIVVEAIGKPDLVVNIATLVRKGGELILLGSPRGKAELNITQFLRCIHRGEVVLKGAHESILPTFAGLNTSRSREENSKHIMDLIQNDLLVIDKLITHRIVAEEIGHAYEDLLNKKDQSLGVIVRW